MRRVVFMLALLPSIAAAQPVAPPSSLRQDYVSTALGMVFNETMNAYVNARGALLRQGDEIAQAQAKIGKLEGDLAKAQARVKELEDAAKAPPKTE